MCRKLDARVFKIVGGFSLFYGDAPYFSTDHNAAFEVVDKMVSVGYTRYDITCWSKGEVTVSFEMPRVSTTSYTGEDIKVSICLAALRAKGDGEWVDEYLNKEIEDE